MQQATLSLYLTVWLAASAIADPLQAGIASTDITPPIPFRMSGYFTERLSTGTKDPLHSKAVVFSQGSELAALVFCDIVSLPREITDPARAGIASATNIPTDRIAICATHSHTGPLIYGALSDHFHQASIARSGDDPFDPAGYRARLIGRIVESAVSAMSARAAVTLRSGYAVEDQLAFNRRFHMKDGTVQFNPGRDNPNIVRAAGPVDPQVGIVTLSAIEPPAKSPVAAIVSFAMHLDTVGGTQYSADYPFYVQSALRKAFGPKFLLLFGTGTCGDINHIDIRAKANVTTEQIGATLGDTVERAIQRDDLINSDVPSLKVARATISVPLQQFSAEQRAQAISDLKLIGTRELSLLAQVEAYKIADMDRFSGKSLELEVQAFRIGRETAIVTLPTEVFVEFGLAIKAASPFDTTLVIELTNDSLGYIPTERAFAEGSYETVNSRVSPGAGEAMVEAAVKLLKELDQF